MNDKFSKLIFERSEAFDKSIEEEIAFRDRVMKIIRELYPDYIVRPHDSGKPDMIFIGNKQDNVRIHFPTHDVFARFAQTGRTNTDLKDVVLDHFADMLRLAEDADLIVETDDVPWFEAQQNLELMLTGIYEIEPFKDEILCQPFGTNIVVCPVINNPSNNLIGRIKRIRLEQWSVTEDVVFQRAFENLSHACDGFELVGVPPPHGHLRNEKSNGNGASSILVRGIRELIGENIGLPFRFGIPSRHLFYAWAELEDKEFQQEMRTLMAKEMKRLPSRLTDDIYQVDENLRIAHIKEP